MIMIMSCREVNKEAKNSKFMNNMKKNEILIECKRVRFYSSYDEDAFFEWLKKIKNVKSVRGKGDSILFTVSSLSDKELHNLIGLFRRYKIEMNDLEQVLNSSQQKLFNEYQKGHHINVYPKNQLKQTIDALLCSFVIDFQNFKWQISSYEILIINSFSMFFNISTFIYNN